MAAQSQSKYKSEILRWPSYPSRGRVARRFGAGLLVPRVQMLCRVCALEPGCMCHCSARPPLRSPAQSWDRSAGFAMGWKHCLHMLDSGCKLCQGIPVGSFRVCAPWVHLGRCPVWMRCHQLPQGIAQTRLKFFFLFAWEYFDVNLLS